MQLPAPIAWVKAHWRSIVLIMWPLILMPLLLTSGTKEARCGYVVLVMAVYWMTEVVPLAITALLPVMLFPLLGVMSTDAVCIVYLKETNMMFVGGLIVAIAIEHCNLHKRIALKVLLMIGTSPKLLMLGFMLNTMFLSMWINNTATVAMMVPIVQAVLEELKESNLGSGNRNSIRGTTHNVRPRLGSGAAHESRRPSQHEISRHEGLAVVTVCQNLQEDLAALKREEERKTKAAERQYYKDTLCYYLGVAYAANIGGTGTITGTGTNLTFMGVYQNIFPDATGLNFASWMIFNVPVMLVNVFLAWLWLQVMYMGLLTRGFKTSKGDNSAAVRELISGKYQELGPMNWHQSSVLTLFVTVVLLWFFRKPEFIPGWSSLLPGVSVKDATPAILVVFLLFVLPSDLRCLDFSQKGLHRKASPSLLTWRVVHEKLPWGLILLLGGGFAMAEASKVSGLSEWLGGQLVGLQVLPNWLIVTVICLMSTFATEVSSNTAIANILLPVLAEMSKAIRVHPLYLMMPATLCCSYSFMLPVATPPNAIVVEASNMKTKDMMKAGIVMNLLTVGVLVLSFNTLATYVYGLHEFPAWAEDPAEASISPVVLEALNATQPASLL